MGIACLSLQLGAYWNICARFSFFSESMPNLAYEEAKRFLLSHEFASWVNRRYLM
jgi:hypothetical protein